MIRKLIPFIFCAVLVACNNNASKNQQNEDTVDVEETYVEPVPQEIVSAFPAAYQFFSERDSSFSASKFSEATTDTAVNNALPLSESLKPFYPYFIYNPDSSYAVDLYSYNILFVKRNGKVVAETSGPDTEVALVDFNKKKRKRIYFGGTSSAVLDAKWISKDQVLLLTGEVIDRATFQPELLKYNVGDSTINDFVYPDTLQLNISDYEDKRLKGL